MHDLVYVDKFFVTGHIDDYLAYISSQYEEKETEIKINSFEF